MIPWGVAHVVGPEPSHAIPREDQTGSIRQVGGPVEIAIRDRVDEHLKAKRQTSVASAKSNYCG